MRAIGSHRYWNRITHPPPILQPPPPPRTWSNCAPLSRNQFSNRSNLFMSSSSLSSECADICTICSSVHTHNNNSHQARSLPVPPVRTGPRTYDDIGITQKGDGFLYRTPEESNYPVVFCLFKKVLFIHSYFLCVFCSCKMSNMHLAIVRRDSLAFILLFGIHFGLVKSYM